MGDQDIIMDSGQAEEKKDKSFLGKLFASFADSLNQAPIGPATLDTVEAPQVESPNYTPLYVIAALAVGAVVYFAMKTGKK